MGADLEGTDDVLGMLDKLGEVGPTMMDLWGTDFLLIVDDEVPVDTHNLQWSIPANTDKGDWQWIVGTNVEYAPYVHEGHMTRPRTIDTGSYGGKMSYGGAQHFVPGNPFFDRTLSQTESKLQEYLTEAMEGVEG